MQDIISQTGSDFSSGTLTTILSLFFCSWIRGSVVVSIKYTHTHTHFSVLTFCLSACSYIHFLWKTALCPHECCEAMSQLCWRVAPVPCMNSICPHYVSVSVTCICTRFNLVCTAQAASAANLGCIFQSGRQSLQSLKTTSIQSMRRAKYVIIWPGFAGRCVCISQVPHARALYLL